MVATCRRTGTRSRWLSPTARRVLNTVRRRGATFEAKASGPLDRWRLDDCAHTVRPEGRFDDPCMGRQVARCVPRPRRARAFESDDRRRDRGAQRSNDPGRRPLARGLCIMQLPGIRSRASDHRVRAGVPGRVGNAPELVAPARQSRPLYPHRGASHRAARSTGHVGAPDDHAHPHVGDPCAGRRRDDLRRVAGAQDRSTRGASSPLHGAQR